MVAVSTKMQSQPTEVLMSQLVAMFCDIDDFCKVVEPIYTRVCSTAASGSTSGRVS